VVSVLFPDPSVYAQGALRADQEGWVAQARNSMQPRLPTCENTLKWVSEHAIPSLEDSFVTRRFRPFAGPPRGQSVDDVIQDQRHNRGRRGVAIAAERARRIPAAGGMPGKRALLKQIRTSISPRAPGRDQTKERRRSSALVQIEALYRLEDSGDFDAQWRTPKEQRSNHTAPGQAVRMSGRGWAGRVTPLITVCRRQASSGS
jgi:hypothetical protein